MKRKLIGLTILSLVSFGAGGCVATDAERDHQSSIPTSHSVATQPETQVITKTVTKVRTVDELNPSCKLFVSMVNKMYDALLEYSAARGDLSTVIDTVAQAIVTGDKALQNKADIQLRELNKRLLDANESLSVSQYAVQNHSTRCQVD